MMARAPGPVALALIAIAVLALAMHLGPSLGFRQSARHAPGIPYCHPSAAADVLGSGALQCWMQATHGLWRILAHASAHGALVIETSADDLLDADQIRRVVAASVGTRFAEVLLYVRLEQPRKSRTVRFRWTRHGRAERLDF